MGKLISAKQRKSHISYSINNISNTNVTIRKNSKFTVPVIVFYQATDRPIHHTLK